VINEDVNVGDVSRAFGVADEAKDTSCVGGSGSFVIPRDDDEGGIIPFFLELSEGIESLNDGVVTRPYHMEKVSRMEDEVHLVFAYGG
jgi:hypothetical protein